MYLHKENDFSVYVYTVVQGQNLMSTKCVQGIVSYEIVMQVDMSHICFRPHLIPI